MAKQPLSSSGFQDLSGTGGVPSVPVEKYSRRPLGARSEGSLAPELRPCPLHAWPTCSHLSLPGQIPEAELCSQEAPSQVKFREGGLGGAICTVGRGNFRTWATQKGLEEDLRKCDLHQVDLWTPGLLEA